MKEFQAGRFYIPPYQREFIWQDHHRNNFIESVILGFPIPMMFIAEVDDGRLEIVDGAQRIQTLEQFLNNDLRLKKLKKLTTLNGLVFSDLPISHQRRLGARALRLVVLEVSTTAEIRYEIFKRVNTSGEKARASEVRRGAYSGPFMKFIEKCAKDPLFVQLCPITEPLRLRREGEELVLRFFAYSDHYREFRHDVEKFLDGYVEDNMSNFDRDRMEAEFTRMLTFVEKHFPYGFAKDHGSKITPRVRFEAISVGVNLALREEPALIPSSTSWLESDEFRLHTTTHASNSSKRLRGRIEFVRNALCGT